MSPPGIFISESGRFGYGQGRFLACTYEKRLECYTPFKNYLIRSGFTVYPTEFACFPSQHPLVDIAAKMGNYFWAFEYKSKNDCISRGVEQLRAYSEWFDLVVLVSERNLSHSTSENYWKLKGLGAGLWNYDPLREDRCLHKTNPSIQKPIVGNKRLVSRRFRALGKQSGVEETSWRQLLLCNF